MEKKIIKKKQNLKVLEVLIEELIRQRQMFLNSVPLYDDLDRREQEQKIINLSIF
jgi:hypothetical protein